MPTPLPIRDRPVRVAVVGLGQICELVLPTYAGNGAVEVVALCDLSPERLVRWAGAFPGARLLTSLDEVLALEADVVDVLIPTPTHAEVAVAVLGAGRHLHIQKPLARTVEEADAILAAAASSGATVRVMEDYLFYPPLRRLRDLLEAGAIGGPVGVHMKIVATGPGGWEVPASSYRWQFEQLEDGRGMLVFDHGWHQLAVAHWLFGPIRRIFAWIGQSEVAPELAPGLMLDAPSSLLWEHQSGVRGALDIHLAPQTYFRSDYYGCDERIEVTGASGYLRVNRISACGIEEPSLVLYRDGETCTFHALDDRPPDAFAASTAHWLEHLRTGAEPLEMDAGAAHHVLRALNAALESSRLGRVVEV